MNIKKQNAFTLAEMLIVLIIICIIMAVSLPIITVKTKAGSKVGSGKELWKEASGGNIYYNAGGVSVGVTDFLAGENAKFQINAPDKTYSQILFKENGNKTGDLVLNSVGSIGISNSSVDMLGNLNNIYIGNTVRPGGKKSVVIGAGAGMFSGGDPRVTGESTVSLGNNSFGYGNYSVAIGFGATALAPASVAIGQQAYAGENGGGSYNVAIGPSSQADGGQSIAIGYSATNNETKTIQLGNYANTKIKYYGTLTSVSDRRLKNVGSEFTQGLDKIREIKPYNYTFKNDKSKTHQVGIMAQDLAKIFPDAVSKNSDGFLNIRKEDMFFAVINAIKELDIKSKKLEAENAALKKQNQDFEKRLKKLETRK